MSIFISTDREFSFTEAEQTAPIPFFTLPEQIMQISRLKVRTLKEAIKVDATNDTTSWYLGSY